MSQFVKTVVWVCAVTLCATSQQVAAQHNTLSKENIPRIAIDTLPTDRDEVRIVTFSDGTFRYIPTNPYHFLSAPAYETHWDTLNLFAYRTIGLADLPERISVEMPDAHGFHAPVVGKVLSKYGRRGRRDHNGTDIAVTHGQPIFAAFDGIVRLSRWNSGGFGNIVIIRHPNGLETYYAHLSRRAVAAAEWVRAGQVIGYGGRTGRASANHLHFETRYCDQSFDAERLIDFERGELRRRTLALRKEYFSIRSRAVEGIEDESGMPAADSLAGAAPADLLLADASGGTGGVDAQSARTGAEIITPEPPKPAAPEPVYHKIKSGDTLLALAMQYGTTVANICNLNGISRTTTLRIGRNLRIK